MDYSSLSKRYRSRAIKGGGGGGNSEEGGKRNCFRKEIRPAMQMTLSDESDPHNGSLPCTGPVSDVNFPYRRVTSPLLSELLLVCISSQ